MSGVTHRVARQTVEVVAADRGVADRLADRAAAAAPLLADLVGRHLDALDDGRRYRIDRLVLELPRCDPARFEDSLLAALDRALAAALPDHLARSPSIDAAEAALDLLAGVVGTGWLPWWATDEAAPAAAVETLVAAGPAAWEAMRRLLMDPDAPERLARSLPAATLARLAAALLASDPEAVTAAMLSLAAAAGDTAPSDAMRGAWIVLLRRAGQGSGTPPRSPAGERAPGGGSRAGVRGTIGAPDGRRPPRPGADERRQNRASDASEPVLHDPAAPSPELESVPLAPARDEPAIVRARPAAAVFPDPAAITAPSIEPDRGSLPHRRGAQSPDRDHGADARARPPAGAASPPAAVIRAEPPVAGDGEPWPVPGTMPGHVAAPGPAAASDSTRPAVTGGSAPGMGDGSDFDDPPGGRRIAAALHHGSGEATVRPDEVAPGARSGTARDGYRRPEPASSQVAVDDRPTATDPASGSVVTGGIPRRPHADELPDAAIGLHGSGSSVPVPVSAIGEARLGTAVAAREGGWAAVSGAGHGEGESGIEDAVPRPAHPMAHPMPTHPDPASAWKVGGDDALYPDEAAAPRLSPSLPRPMAEAKVVAPAAPGRAAMTRGRSGEVASAGEAPVRPPAYPAPTGPGAVPARDAGGHDALYPDNAGLALLWPSFPRLIAEAGLVDAEGRFAGPVARCRAAMLLDHLVTGERDPPETRLALAKLFAGLPVDAVLDPGPPLTDAESATAAAMLAGAVRALPMLGRIGIDGLRGAWLARPGRLAVEHGGWTLRVERRVWDVLLARVPWTVTGVALPWMPEPVRVEW